MPICTHKYRAQSLLFFMNCRSNESATLLSNCPVKLLMTRRWSTELLCVFYTWFKWLVVISTYISFSNALKLIIATIKTLRKSIFKHNHLVSRNVLSRSSQPKKSKTILFFVVFHTQFFFLFFFVSKFFSVKFVSLLLIQRQAKVFSGAHIENWVHTFESFRYTHQYWSMR